MFTTKNKFGDDVPSSSRMAMEKTTRRNIKKSSLKSGYIKKFQKIRDNKAVSREFLDKLENVIYMYICGSKRSLLSTVLYF